MSRVERKREGMVPKGRKGKNKGTGKRNRRRMEKGSRRSDQEEVLKEGKERNHAGITELP